METERLSIQEKEQRSISNARLRRFGGGVLALVAMPTVLLAACGGHEQPKPNAVIDDPKEGGMYAILPPSPVPGGNGAEHSSSIFLKNGTQVTLECRTGENGQQDQIAIDSGGHTGSGDGLAVLAQLGDANLDPIGSGTLLTLNNCNPPNSATHS